MIFPIDNPKIQDPIIAIIIPTEVKQPEPIKVTVVAGDTLTSIATTHQTTVQRLWAANTQLTDPNVLEVGQELIAPLNTDVLPERAMPVTIPVASGQTSAPSGRSYVSGNTYSPGQCTAFVKDQLGWVQNGWGNASDWKYRSGHTVSATPAVGTVAWAKGYGHVAIVTAVGSGTVTVVEQNYKGPYIVSSRVAPTSEFEYIYP